MNGVKSRFGTSARSGGQPRVTLLATLFFFLMSISFAPASASASQGGGELVSWGYDAYAQVRSTPTGAGFTAVAAGMFHSVAVKADGSLVSWGDDSFGQQVSNTPAGTGFIGVAAGGYHSVAIKSDGGLLSWGDDSFGVVTSTPTGTGFKAVAAGGGHSVAIRADGSLISWGYDGFGQVRNTPTGTGFVGVSANNGHSVAIKSDGSLLSWGFDDYGQVRNTPTGTGFKAVAAGGYHSVAIKADGSVVSWGDDGHRVLSTTPTGTGFIAVAAGGTYALAIRADGSLVPWGWAYPTLSQTPAGTGFVSIAAGWDHILAIKANETTTPDVTAPSVAGQAHSAPNLAGWYSGPVTVSWTATDDMDGLLGSPTPTTLDEDGADQTATSANVCDAAGNCAYGELPGISIDKVKPEVTDVTLTSSPLAINATAQLSAIASDTLSGVAGGEWFLDTDPGAGAGTAMELDGPDLTAQVPASATAGVHTVGVRAVDRAGNWGPTSTAFLVVYDPDGGYVTGGGWVIPGGKTSDVGDALPGLDATSKATFGFVVKYGNGQSTVPGGNLQFHYKAGNFTLKSSGMEWLVVTNDNWGKFKGEGTVDGIDGQVPFSVDARDSDRSGQPDRFVIRIWAPGANTNTEQPTYKATGDVQGGQIQIHKS